MVAGVIGIAKDGRHKADYQPGMELRGKYVFIAEGVRGSLAKEIIAKFNLPEGREPQKFGIGMKELWEVPPENHKQGLVQPHHGLAAGPEDRRRLASCITWGDNLVSIGFVVHLNYKNPWLYPFVEFQRFKHHPLIAQVLRGRQAHRLWRARHHRRRLAVGAETLLPRRRADRLLRRLRQRAAHQGQPQRHEDRHAGGRGGLRGARRRAARAMSSPAYETAYEKLGR